MSYDSAAIIEMKEDIQEIQEKINSLLELTIMIAKKLGVVGERQ